jgi:hypothetical protein
MHLGDSVGRRCSIVSKAREGEQTEIFHLQQQQPILDQLLLLPNREREKEGERERARERREREKER